MTVHLHMSLSLKPYSWHIVHYANLILCLFNHDFQCEKLERRRFRIVKWDGLPRSSQENNPSEVQKKTEEAFRQRYLDWVMFPCCRAPRATAWYGGNSASPPTRLCRGLSGRECSCPGWYAANGEVMKIKSHTFFVNLLSELRVRPRTKEDSSITKVHKKRWTNQKPALLQVSGNFSSLRNASKTLRFKNIYTYFPNILTMNYWRLWPNLRMLFKSYSPIQGIALLNSSAKTCNWGSAHMKAWLVCFCGFTSDATQKKLIYNEPKAFKWMKGLNICFDLNQKNKNWSHHQEPA